LRLLLLLLLLPPLSCGGVAVKAGAARAVAARNSDLALGFAARRPRQTPPALLPAPAKPPGTATMRAVGDYCSRRTRCLDRLCRQALPDAVCTLRATTGHNFLPHAHAKLKLRRLFFQVHRELGAAV
jgi:hypothetical protein